MRDSTPSEGNKVIDSRDVIEAVNRFDFGEEDVDTFDLEADEKSEEPKLDEDERALVAFHREGESTFGREWKDGVALVSDSHFEEYAEELADDIGAIDKNATWPLTHIDWEAAAEELKQDYSSINFRGTEYWGRS